jgi:hypothetical protein
MRKVLKLLITLTVIIAVPLGMSLNGWFFAGKAQAASSSLSLSSASQTVTQGQNLVIVIKVDTGGDPVNVVQANLSYSTALFDTVTISNSSSFGIVAENVASGGTIRIARGTFTPVTGIADVATITLHTAASGSAALNFMPGSLVVRSTDNLNILSTNPGATYTINGSSTTPPPPPPSPKQGDLNNDNNVDIYDLSILLSHYGLTSSTGDVNSDGTVNIFDLSILLSNYGK